MQQIYSNNWVPLYLSYADTFNVNQTIFLKIKSSILLKRRTSKNIAKKGENTGGQHFKSIFLPFQGFSWADFGAEYRSLSQLQKSVKFPNFQVQSPKIMNEIPKVSAAENCGKMTII